MSRRLVEETIARFRGRFHEEPTAIARAPGRVNLIGEHTDYNDGFVLPIAIDRQTVAAACVVDSNTSHLYAADLDSYFQIDLRARLEPLPADHSCAFVNYVLGVMCGFQERGCTLPNMNVLIQSNVPIGAGLSSSASVEVAVASLLEALLAHHMDPLEKALLCQRAEHAFPGTPCGIMDMYASTFGKCGHALLLDCRTNQSRLVSLPGPENMTLLIVNTGVRHALADGAYANRRAACESAVYEIAKTHDVHSLRDVTPEMLKSTTLTTEQRRRATHVVQENARVLQAVSALERGDVCSFCQLMHQSHASLRDLYEVSCAELDCIVEAASAYRELRGVTEIGARMTGGGFGGCAIVVVPTDHASGVGRFIASKFREQFGRSPMSFRTHASEGARAEILS